jgi:hypothetical protein
MLVGGLSLTRFSPAQKPRIDQAGSVYDRQQGSGAEARLRSRMVQKSARRSELREDKLNILSFLLVRLNPDIDPPPWTRRSLRELTRSMTHVAIAIYLIPSSCILFSAMGVDTHPGATTLTRALGWILTISFFRDRVRP